MTAGVVDLPKDTHLNWDKPYPLKSETYAVLTHLRSFVNFVNQFQTK